VLKRIVMISALGTGKGTQAQILSVRHGLVHLSAGQILRDFKKKDPAEGKRIDSIINGGNLVPDIMINRIMHPHIMEHMATGFSADGYPRRIGQADYLAELCEVDAAISFTVSDEDVIVERILARSTCASCGYIHGSILGSLEQKGVCPKCIGKMSKRKDSQDAKTIRRRIEIYNTESAPLTEYYERLGLLHMVNGEGTIEEIHQRVMEVLNDVSV